MIIEIDGNDGVGKTTYIKRLQEIFPNDIFLDRGLLSKATLHADWETNGLDYDKILDGFNDNICYILLDTYPEQSQERILKRGDRIDVPYHNMEDLLKFQKRFKIPATSNYKRKIPMYMTYMDFNDNISRIVNYINGFKQGKNFMEVIVGTTNKGKIREIASILSPLGLDLTPQSLDIEEIGKTIEENATVKAMGYCNNNKDKFVICEDSGLVIPELNGLPGAYSARFHSVKLDDNLNVLFVPKEDFTTDKTEHDRLNNERLIELIKKIPFEKRNAYFEVCFTVMKNGVELFKVTKQSHGFVIDELKGKNGFGYDPIFVGNDTFGKTYAELDSARKNLRSHRKAALNEVGRFFAEYLKNNNK